MKPMLQEKSFQWISLRCVKGETKKQLDWYATTTAVRENTKREERHYKRDVKRAQTITINNLTVILKSEMMNFVCLLWVYGLKKPIIDGGDLLLFLIKVFLPKKTFKKDMGRY